MSVATHPLHVHLVTEQVARWSEQSLLEELYLTVKPGLIDKCNNGAHLDMTLAMMEASSHAIAPYFAEMARVSYGKSPSHQLREQLSEIGIEAEREMLHVTGGVNTHKGAIWCLGLLSAAYAIQRGQGTASTLCEVAGKLANVELEVPSTRTNGSTVCKRYGVTGAKGEAQAGFPHVLLGLRTLNTATESFTETKAKQMALLTLMTTLSDTCVLHRAGSKGLSYVKQQAQQVLRGALSMEEVDERFIKNNLSPGGSADLLAASLYVKRLGGKSHGRVSLHV
ncbi:triphosphoribosyl-dephospho-CoA synthase [Geomicrobium sediminis]|uniref:triphosphoribosyl-dephospho-CoA synthase n=1 Tax=Geomicrobium sediminis TaxID=1347788 RepID=A0ABS2PCC4_9BACL|nr:triphosphoribosyl-dephospho-CoA synthase [Geomicrobium sediminis]